jgi:5'-nucleotidase
LVVGVASSALFDLSESDQVFRDFGPIAYREFQEQNLDNRLSPGVAFGFIERLLGLNDLASKVNEPLVEVIILSRNSPETGLRVMRSIAQSHLPITRSVFTEGSSPFKYMPAFKMSLFLSANESDVRAAIEQGLPAGQVLPSASNHDSADRTLRVAFDFDGVLADDESERIYKEHGLEQFAQHEADRVGIAHDPGPLMNLLRHVNSIQRIEEERALRDLSYEKRLSVSIVTARNSPAHERARDSLRRWGVFVDNAFFLGGIPKHEVIEILNPHIFFDDQIDHLEGSAKSVPSVHIPFGVANSR